MTLLFLGFVLVSIGTGYVLAAINPDRNRATRAILAIMREIPIPSPFPDRYLVAQSGIAFVVIGVFMIVRGLLR